MLHATRTAFVAALGGLVALGCVARVGAEEAKTPINAALILTIVGAPIERRETAFDQALKEGGPRAPGPAGIVQDDGSVRYGSVSVTVKNPCPPGTAHYEPPPLPGRRARN